MTKHDQLAIGRVTVLYTFLNRKIVVFFKGHGLGLWSGLPKKLNTQNSIKPPKQLKNTLGISMMVPEIWEFPKDWHFHSS
jgi:hypothetical protein